VRSFPHFSFRPKGEFTKMAGVSHSYRRLKFVLETCEKFATIQCYNRTGLMGPMLEGAVKLSTVCGIDVEACMDWRSSGY
jgi:hypothetical protein